MSFIFLRNRVTGGAAFTPASLFSSGEEGAWYEPSTTTCFTDTGGTAAANVGDVVARINDLSGNGNHATQATEPYRPILARVPSGGRRNELSETDTLATQSVTVTAAQRTLSFTGTGTVTLTGASTAGPLVGTGAGDRVSLTFTPSAGSLTLTVLGTVTDAQLELGASATTYQSVADSLGYDITEAGVTSLEYLAFDGADDFMVAASGATYPISTAMAGVKFNTIESDDSVLTGGAGGGETYLTGFQTLASGSLLSATFVVFNDLRIDDASPGSLSIGANHILFGSSTKAPPLQFSNGIVIGRDRALTLPRYLDGNFYGLVTRDSNLSADDKSNLQSYLAAKSGVTL